MQYKLLVSDFDNTLVPPKNGAVSMGTMYGASLP